MDDRGQFTFWRSIYESISLLEPEDQLPLYDAVCNYSLNGIEPENLTKSQLSLFLAFKPTLAKGRSKSANGKQGGSKTKANKKQTVSKKKANKKQTVSEGEKEEEREREKEIEIEIEVEKEKRKKKEKADFESFWNAYPRHTDKQGAEKAFAKVTVPVETLLSAISQQKLSRQWQEDGGKYIPYPATWLNQKRWEDELPPASPQTKNGYAETPSGYQRVTTPDEIEDIKRMLAQPLPYEPLEAIP